MNKKNSIIASAAQLFQQQGINAIGIKEILIASQVPKGSLYYYFPNGKREIIIEAIKYVGIDLCNNVKTQLNSAANFEISLHNLISGMIESLKHANCVGTWSLSLMVLETVQDKELNELCQQIVSTLSNLYTEKLRSFALPDETAQQLGLTIQSNIEGALLTCVALNNTQQLEIVEKQIAQLVRSAVDAK